MKIYFGNFRAKRFYFQVSNFLLIFSSFFSWSVTGERLTHSWPTFTFVPLERLFQSVLVVQDDCTLPFTRC